MAEVMARRPSAAPGKPGTPWSVIRNQIQTYDLLLFRGADFVSEAISKVEEHGVGIGDFTHVGLAVWARDLPAGSKFRRPGDDAKLYVLESTASGRIASGPGDLDRHSHLGVQLRDMDEVVPSYDVFPRSRLAWAPLRDSPKPAAQQAAPEPGSSTATTSSTGPAGNAGPATGPTGCSTAPATRPQPNPAVLENVLERYMDLFYDANCLDLLASALPSLRSLRTFFHGSRCVVQALCCCGCVSSPCRSRQVNKWYFCSELVSQIYIDLGVFPATLNPANVMPSDFLPKSALADAGFLLGDVSPPSSSQTVDADREVPWVFRKVVRFHSDT